MSGLARNVQLILKPFEMYLGQNGRSARIKAVLVGTLMRLPLAVSVPFSKLVQVVWKGFRSA